MARNRMYLAGAIEKSIDHGVGIRKKIIKQCKDLDLKLISPCDFDYNQAEYPTMWAFQRNKENDFEECIRHSRNIVEGDLEHVRMSDFILVILDENCGCGTASEVTVAREEHVPVLGIFTNPEKWREVHPWILSCVSRVFNSIDDLKTFLISFYGVEKRR